MKKFITLSTCLLAIGGYANALSIAGIGSGNQLKKPTKIEELDSIGNAAIPVVQLVDFSQAQ